MILQCVNELYELIQTTLWEETEPRINRLVFIGNKEKGRQREMYIVIVFLHYRY